MARSSDREDPAVYSPVITLQTFPNDHRCQLSIRENGSTVFEKKIKRHQQYAGLAKFRGFRRKHPLKSFDSEDSLDLVSQDPHNNSSVTATELKAGEHGEGKRRHIQKSSRVRAYASQFGLTKRANCVPENIDVHGKREWVLLKVGVPGKASDFVIDARTNGSTVLAVPSDDNSQRWWFEGGIIRNKEYPNKVLAVAKHTDKQRPNEKLGLLVLVDENTHDPNQRWIYHKDDCVFENGHPGRYVIDGWHNRKQFADGNVVIVHRNLGKGKQCVEMRKDPLTMLTDETKRAPLETTTRDKPSTHTLDNRRKVQETLRQARPELRKHLNVNTDFLVQLGAAGVISDDQRERIQDLRIAERIDALVDILMRQTKENYASFKEILREKDEEIYDYLVGLEDSHLPGPLATVDIHEVDIDFSDDSGVEDANN